MGSVAHACYGFESVKDIFVNILDNLSIPKLRALYFVREVRRSNMIGIYEGSFPTLEIIMCHWFNVYSNEDYKHPSDRLH